MFENVEGRTTDRRLSDWYTISSPMSFSSGELKIKKNQNMQRVRYELRIRNTETFSIILSCKCTVLHLLHIFKRISD